MPVQTLSFAELDGHVGRYLGASGWTTIKQVQTDQFAFLTGDEEWIHVDVNRAALELGGTIIHGYHLLSLIPALSQQIFRVEGVSHGLNYGIDRLRFVDPVRPGEHLRLHETLLSVRRRGEASMMTIAARVEIEGKVRPAMVANCVFLIMPDMPPSANPDRPEIFP